jgi:hypothetical protein
VFTSVLSIFLGVTAGAPPDQLDAFWEKRLQPGAVRRLIELGERMAARDPNDYEIAWRVARGFWWLAFAERNRSFKRGLARSGMEWGDRARRLNGGRIEGHFLYALSLGEYAQSIGIATAVWQGLDRKFEEAAAKAYGLDRDFELGGPITALGRYYYLLPWPKRDLKKSRRYLEEARKRHPGALLNRFYLAETCHDLGDDAAARRELEFVLGAGREAASRAIPPPPLDIAAEHLRRWFE